MKIVGAKIGGKFPMYALSDFANTYMIKKQLVKQFKLFYNRFVSSSFQTNKIANLKKIVKSPIAFICGLDYNKYIPSLKLCSKSKTFFNEVYDTSDPGLKNYDDDRTNKYIVFDFESYLESHEIQSRDEKDVGETMVSNLQSVLYYYERFMNFAENIMKGYVHNVVYLGQPAKKQDIPDGDCRVSELDDDNEIRYDKSTQGELTSGLYDELKTVVRSWYNDNGIKMDIGHLYYSDDQNIIRKSDSEQEEYENRRIGLIADDDEKEKSDWQIADIYPAYKMLKMIFLLLVFSTKYDGSDEDFMKMIASYVAYIQLFNSFCAAKMNSSWNDSVCNTYVYEYKNNNGQENNEGIMIEPDYEKLAELTGERVAQDAVPQENRSSFFKGIINTTTSQENKCNKWRTIIKEFEDKRQKLVPQNKELIAEVLSLGKLHIEIIIFMQEFIKTAEFSNILIEEIESCEKKENEAKNQGSKVKRKTLVENWKKMAASFSAKMNFLRYVLKNFNVFVINLENIIENISHLLDKAINLFHDFRFEYGSQVDENAIVEEVEEVKLKITNFFDYLQMIAYFSDYSDEWENKTKDISGNVSKEFSKFREILSTKCPHMDIFVYNDWYNQIEKDFEFQKLDICVRDGAKNNDGILLHEIVKNKIPFYDFRIHDLKRSEFSKPKDFEKATAFIIYNLIPKMNLEKTDIGYCTLNYMRNILDKIFLGSNYDKRMLREDIDEIVLLKRELKSDINIILSLSNRKMIKNIDNILSSLQDQQLVENINTELLRVRRDLEEDIDHDISLLSFLNLDEGIDNILSLLKDQRLKESIENILSSLQDQWLEEGIDNILSLSNQQLMKDIGEVLSQRNILKYDLKLNLLNAIIRMFSELIVAVFPIDDKKKRKVFDNSFKYEEIKDLGEFNSFSHLQNLINELTHREMKMLGKIDNTESCLSIRLSFEKLLIEKLLEVNVEDPMLLIVYIGIQLNEYLTNSFETNCKLLELKNSNNYQNVSFDDRIIESLRNIHQFLLDFIEDELNIEEHNQKLIKTFEEAMVPDYKNKFTLILHLINDISMHKHRNNMFWNKIEHILEYIMEIINGCFENDEIFDIFKYNKRLLLFLFEEEIVSMDNNIFMWLIYRNDNTNHLFEFFKPELNEFIGFLWTPNDSCFYEKRKDGENDNDICSVIRKDCLEDFIKLMDKSVIKAEDFIPTSIFETNDFLLCENVSYIQYAAFFGSVRIFKYLLSNSFKGDPRSLFVFAVYGKNAEIIYCLEEQIENMENMENYLLEIEKAAIKCHCDAMFNYFFDKYHSETFGDESYKYTIKVLSECKLQYHNFILINDSMLLDQQMQLIILYEFHYYLLVNDFIKNKKKLLDDGDNLLQMMAYILKCEDVEQPIKESVLLVEKHPKWIYAFDHRHHFEHHPPYIQDNSPDILLEHLGPSKSSTNSEDQNRQLVEFKIKDDSNINIVSTEEYFVASPASNFTLLVPRNLLFKIKGDKSQGELTRSVMDCSGLSLKMKNEIWGDEDAEKKWDLENVDSIEVPVTQSRQQIQRQTSTSFSSTFIPFTPKVGFYSLSEEVNNLPQEVLQTLTLISNDVLDSYPKAGMTHTSNHNQIRSLTIESERVLMLGTDRYWRFMYNLNTKQWAK